jgi:hypothetical protein
MRLLGVAFAMLAAACGQPVDDAVAVDAAPAGPVIANVIAVKVTGPGGAPPVKGEPLHVTLTVKNTGTGAGTVAFTPRVTSARFTDFTDVPLGEVSVQLEPTSTTDATLVVGPFLEDGGDHYALGRGDYTVEVDGVEAAFVIAASDAVFDVVLYDADYFTAIKWSGTPEEFVRTANTRAAELFTPSSQGSSNGTYKALPGGFDELMRIEQHVLALEGLTASEAAGGFCEQVAAQARTALGLTRDWDIDESQPAHTDVDHHGFDLLIGLTPDMGGGAACGWLGVQVSGVFGFDLSLERSQIILVHETGHLFGAPHCDPLQGYVMCAGEKHDRYKNGGVFVWHQVSRDAMTNRWE